MKELVQNSNTWWAMVQKIQEPVFNKHQKQKLLFQKYIIEAVCWQHTIQFCSIV